MIESCYWKSDLLKHARRLRSVKKPQRWSEKLAVDFEKELIISFFMIRKLFEGHKLSSKSQKNRNWGGVYVCSDFERRKSIYRIPLAEIRAILNVVGTDYPQEITMTYNKKIGDYAVT